MAHGTYRGIYASLPDDPDFQRLTPFARLAFYTVRVVQQAGPGVIFRYYPEVLMRQSGLGRRQLEGAVAELCRQPTPQAPWVYCDGLVLWVRNGLRHDPNMRLSDAKHRSAVQRQLDSLPKSPVVIRFCDYYGFPRPVMTTPETLHVNPENLTGDATCNVPVMTTELTLDDDTLFARPFEAPSKTLRTKVAPGPPSTSTKKTEYEEDRVRVQGASKALPSPFDGPSAEPTDPDARDQWLDTPHGILAWLNKRAKKNFRPVATNLDPIRARLKDGITPTQLRLVISLKTDKWTSDPKMRDFLRPETLFGKTKCEQYLGELPRTEYP